jgi:hypothetical protein
MKDGEIKELLIRDFPRLTMPYKEIVIEGKIEQDYHKQLRQYDKRKRDN